MVYYILFIQEIKDIILSSMESHRRRDPLNQSTRKIEKTRMDPAGSKLTEPNSGKKTWNPNTHTEEIYLFFWQIVSTRKIASLNTQRFLFSCSSKRICLEDNPRNLFDKFFQICKQLQHFRGKYILIEPNTG